MKKSILYIALSVFGFCFNVANAQTRVNISIQPVWGPVGFNYVEYYYMPDIEVYYYVPLRQYIYLDNAVWITATSLPARYGSFDIYRIHKVVINQPKPYLKHKTYVAKYASYKGRQGQQIIRDSKDSKYYSNPGHPEHDKWKATPGNQGKEKQQKSPQHSPQKSPQKSQGSQPSKSQKPSPQKGKGNPKK